MEEERLKAILESLLFAAGEPVPLARLAAVLENVPREAIRKVLAEIAVAYADGSRGIVLEEVAGGYQLRTAREHALYVRRLLQSKPPRLSRPLLETLAIVAYRQPITRPEIDQLRGVDSGGVLETLLERRLVRIAGRKEAPGRPIIYATTPEFLEVFSLKSLASLPDRDEFREMRSAASVLEGADSDVLAPDAGVGKPPAQINPEASDLPQASEAAGNAEPVGASAPPQDPSTESAASEAQPPAAGDSPESPSRN